VGCIRSEDKGTVTVAMNPHDKKRQRTPGQLGARWTTLLENLLRDLRYAMRGFVRAPVAAFTIIATLGIGLGLLAAVYTILNSMIFKADEVYKPHELFGVERQRSAVSEIETFTRSEYDSFLRETEVFADAFASTGDVRAFIDGVRREGRLVTGNFFQVLGVSAARGRTFTPPDDDPASLPVIVLSHRAWAQQYDSDPGVIGRAYRLNGTTFRVIGVMPEGFRGLEVVAAPDFWAPLAHVDVFRAQATGARIDERLNERLNIVGRLRPDLTREQAVARLNIWDLQRAAGISADRPASLVLAPRLGTVPRPAEAMVAFMPLLFAFGLILMIGCANVANLLLARLVKRQREIGIRLAIGASRARVVWQLLTENLLLALVAAAVAFAVAGLTLKLIVYALTTSFPPDIGSLRIAVPLADWRVALFLIAGALVATVLFALAPALRATRLNVSRSMHGEVMRDGRPGRARNTLVAVQVTGSVLLLICAAVFLRSALMSSTVDPGFRTSDIVTVDVLEEPRREAILDSLSRNASVAAVAASWPAASRGLGGAPAYGEGANGRSVVTYQFVSPEFFDVLGIDIVRGRGFTNSERDPNEPVAVVSESVARDLWPVVDALGQVVRIEPDLTIGSLGPAERIQESQTDDPLLRDRTAVVVGIARDVPGFQVVGTQVGGSGVYMPISNDAPRTVLVARVRGVLERARAGLIDDLASIGPNLAEVSTLQVLANINAYLLGTSFWLTLVLGVLALVMTLTGLYSVLSFLVEQRTREIGVRMALGANRHKIGLLVLWQSARPVGLGLALGGILTASLSTALLSTPVAEPVAATVRLFDPIAYSVSMVCIAAACAGAALLPALRAGRVNPLAALRED